MAAPLSPAVAGPDDGRVVTTRTHVDSPKTFWKNGTFELFNENSGKLDPVEDTVNWVGKGWARDEGEPQYQFRIPEDPHSLGFLGQTGDMWYRSPQRPIANQNPNWTGFGADTAIPADTFRDGAFFLDLVDVNGPGRVEMYNYPVWQFPHDVIGLLSSSREQFRSSALKPGSHTHNETVFSRPGRYELTYRTLARGTDGRVIESKPTTQVWQVGGQRPADATTPSTRERYDAAPSSDASQAGYALRTSPSTAREHEGDENLTTIEFDAGDKGRSGTLTLFVNGYFLTDLAVKDGHAQWDELMGSAPSEIQAVFTPGTDGAAAAQDATAPRWVSPALSYREGQQAEVTSRQGDGEWPQEKREPANTTLDEKPFTPESNEFTLTMDKTDNPTVGDVRLEFADPRIRGAIRGGLYEKPTDKGPVSDFLGSVGGGKGHSYFTQGGDYYNGNTVRVTFLPHPSVNMRGFTFDLPEKFTRGMQKQFKGTFTVSEGGPAKIQLLDEHGNPVDADPKPSDPADPAPTDPSDPDDPGNPADPSDPGEMPKQCTADGLSGRYVLDDGHVDIAAARDGDRLGISLKDETGIHDAQATRRSLDQVAFYLPERTRRERSAQMMDPALDFLGKEGSAFYGLPQSQMEGMLWPGYNTMDLDYSRLKGNVELHLEMKQHPDNAAFGMYTDQLGKPTVLLDTSKDDETIEVGYATHVHTNWAFTQPGAYTLEAYYSAESSDGKKMESQHQQLSVLVGDQGAQACISGKAGPADPENPQDPDKPQKPEDPKSPEKPHDPDQPKNPKGDGSGDRPAKPDPASSGSSGSSGSSASSGSSGSSVAHAVNARAAGPSTSLRSPARAAGPAALSGTRSAEGSFAALGTAAANAVRSPGHAASGTAQANGSAGNTGTKKDAKRRAAPGAQGDVDGFGAPGQAAPEAGQGAGDPAPTGIAAVLATLSSPAVLRAGGIGLGAIGLTLLALYALSRRGKGTKSPGQGS